MKTKLYLSLIVLFVSAMSSTVTFAEEVKEKPAEVNAALGLFPPAEKAIREKTREPAAAIHRTPSYNREATTHVR